MTKIRIGNFELDSSKLPEEGLDYSKFDKQTQNCLSVFDTDDRKGHLSKVELQKAISFFASNDGITIRTENAVVFHKKNNVLDSEEYQKTLEDFNKKLDNSKALKEAKAVSVNENVQMFIDRYYEEHKKYPSNEEITAARKGIKDMVEHEDEFWTKSDTFGIQYDDKKDSHMKRTLYVIYRAIEANKKGLKQSDIGENVFLDKNGKIYTYNENFRKFYPANKEGSYNVFGEPNEKGEKPLIIFDKAGKLLYLKALNKENKAYIKQNYVKKILKNTTIEGNEAKLRDTRRYNNYPEQLRFIPLSRMRLKWNEEKHAFVPKKLDED